ncbi:hypothetical protein BCU17_14095 [Vibrio splendidus]|uniref:branched-chain-amino-acid transaminase n=1 Tax=Vibrio splendidus TaxID=29497 RepID=A0A2N7FIT2_VIBSP|nr:aminotransferase class IV [Vibrio splendidus]PMJ69190.1 hypothetical protein BCU17_14095 [Vibrio splendidus]
MLKNHPQESSTIWLNDEYVLYKDANIRLMTHSLSYATSLFEGIRSYNGRIFKLHEHLVRLERSISIMGWDVEIDYKKTEDRIHKLLEDNGIQSGYIKVLLYLGDGSTGYMGTNCKVNFLISCYAFDEPFNKPIALEIANFKKPEPESFPYKLKGSAGYLLSYLSFNSKSASADDVLFLTKDELVSECSGSNIFFKVDNEWLTPETEVCLDGITAKFIVDEASEALDIKIRYSRISLDMVKKATSAFTCGTAVGVVPISSIEGIKDNYDIFDNELKKIIEYYEVKKQC